MTFLFDFQTLGEPPLMVFRDFENLLRAISRKGDGHERQSGENDGVDLGSQSDYEPSRGRT